MCDDDDEDLVVVVANFFVLWVLCRGGTGHSSTSRDRGCVCVANKNVACFTKEMQTKTTPKPACSTPILIGLKRNSQGPPPKEHLQKKQSYFPSLIPKHNQFARSAAQITQLPPQHTEICHAAGSHPMQAAGMSATVQS